MRAFVSQSEKAALDVEDTDHSLGHEEHPAFPVGYVTDVANRMEVGSVFVVHTSILTQPDLWIMEQLLEIESVYHACPRNGRNSEGGEGKRLATRRHKKTRKVASYGFQAVELSLLPLRARGPARMC
jgi:hypothetical protein